MTTLKEYFENLKSFIEENPDCLELPVIVAKDDEGNGYNSNFFEPQKGHFDFESRDFYTQEQLSEDDYGFEINTVLLN